MPRKRDHSRLPAHQGEVPPGHRPQQRHQRHVHQVLPQVTPLAARLPISFEAEGADRGWVRTMSGGLMVALAYQLILGVQLLISGSKLVGLAVT